MLTYLSSSIWASPAQTLVKTVNVDIPLPNSLKYLTYQKHGGVGKKIRKI
jgi:hypothetical protein